MEWSWPASCGITSVAALLADLLGSSLSTLRQQLREWCYDAEDKKGEHRQEVDVTLCFAPLLCWIASWWPQTECRLALATDATTLSDRFTVLLHQRGVSPLCYSGGVEGDARWGERLMGTVLEDLVYHAARQCAQALDGDCAGRSWVVCAPSSSVTSSRWAGIRFCASIWAARCVRWERRNLIGSPSWCRRREALGAAWWIADVAEHGALYTAGALGCASMPIRGWC